MTRAFANGFSLVERSSEVIATEDLHRLGEIARADREEMFERSAYWGLLLVALCQGAALHYVDGRNGVKDFDVWTFFAALPARYPDPALFRRSKRRDFGPSKLGRTRPSHTSPVARWIC